MRSCGLNKVSKIFLDEVHERSFCNDIIMGTLKNLNDRLLLPTDLKVILCSATLNQKDFRKFFYNCAVVEIKGITHPIIDVYRPVVDLKL